MISIFLTNSISNKLFDYQAKFQSKSFSNFKSKSFSKIFKANLLAKLFEQKELFLTKECKS